MATYTSNSKLLQIHPISSIRTTQNPTHSPFYQHPILQNATNLKSFKPNTGSLLFAIKLEHTAHVQLQEEERPKFGWVEISPKNMAQQQKQVISELPPKMTNRCKAVMRQIICFSAQKGCFQDLLSGWVRIMKPRRNNWLAVLKQLKLTEHNLYSKFGAHGKWEVNRM